MRNIPATHGGREGDEYGTRRQRSIVFQLLLLLGDLCRELNINCPVGSVGRACDSYFVTSSQLQRSYLKVASSSLALDLSFTLPTLVLAS